MKKIPLLLALLLLPLFFLANSLSAQSFNFLERKVTFGISSEKFLESFPEFQIDQTLTSDNLISAVYIFSPGSCDITYTVEFENSKLVTFILHSNCPMGEDQEIIDGILKQFKFIPDKNLDEEEMGDVIETYKKGKLTASAFIGGFYRLTIFIEK